MQASRYPSVKMTITAMMVLSVAALMASFAAGQVEDPKCICAFAYHCDLGGGGGGGMGPEDPSNVLYSLTVDIGSCSGLECEGYCRATASILVIVR